jgi:ABC-type amino acid transport system permease subunit
MLIAGVVLLVTGGIRGFNGSAGSEALLFQILAAGSLMLGLSGVTAFYSGIRSSLGVGVISLILGIVSGIILVLVTVFIVGVPALVVSLLLYILRWRDHGREDSS